jgi:hypothetical protein
MTSEELAGRRDLMIERHGSWLAHNIDVGEGVFTIAPGHVGATERNIAKTVRLVADIAGGRLDGVRILDLGAYECGFSIELAMHGADVTAVEVREQHAAKGEFARQALGLDNLRIIRGDVRDLDTLAPGEYDVVLCLGLIYHLDATDAVALLRRIAERTRRFALIEGQTSLTRARQVDVEGVAYWGRDYPENELDAASGVAMKDAFWFTRPSLVRALTVAGFSTVSEVLSPFVPEILAFEDHVTFVAHKGEAIPMRAVAGDGRPDPAFPERGPRIAHPTQGLRYRVRERIARLRGGGMAAIFPDRPGDE